MTKAKPHQRAQRGSPAPSRTSGSSAPERAWTTCSSGCTSGCTDAASSDAPSSGRPGLRREEREAREKAARAARLRWASGPPRGVAKNLPYGDQRRLEIARALATDPQLLLLDEPAAGMNPQETARLMDLIRQLRDGVRSHRPAHRARHEGGHGHLRADHGARPRREHRRGHARGGARATRGSSRPTSARRGRAETWPTRSRTARRPQLLRRHPGPAAASASRSRRARSSPSSAPTAPARARPCAPSPACSPPPEGTILFEGEEITGCRPTTSSAWASPSARGARHLRHPDRAGEPGAGRLPPQRQGRDPARTWTGVFDAVPAPQGAPPAGGRHPSGGEQQMLAIGRALMARPRLLLLDEPSLGLAPVAGPDHLPDHPRDQRGAPPSCWWSRTPTWPWRSPTAATSWRPAQIVNAAPPPKSCARTQRSAKPTSAEFSLLPTVALSALIWGLVGSDRGDLRGELFVASSLNR